MNNNNGLIAEQIDLIMNTFDFEHVHSLMEKTKWTYFDSDETPSIEELQNTAQMCLNGMFTAGYTSTGGFHAIKVSCSGINEVVNCCKIFLVFGDDKVICGDCSSIGWRL